ncbi:MAG TPA: hypothetical protein PKA05_06360 [Roseiflexaceae bacterium]|nr:hypothetical protein [Roseiflexaceae bacterium]HMP39986.1 hypothetical protein [Roseiflexaceae bacterium]
MNKPINQEDADADFVNPPLFGLLMLTIGLLVATAIAVSHALVAVLSVVLLGAVILSALFAATG